MKTAGLFLAVVAYVLYVGKREQDAKRAACKLIADYAREQQELHEWMYERRWGKP